MPLDLDNVLDELRRLNVPVPRPSRLPTVREVDEALARAGVEIHADFRRFLLAASDVTYGTLEPVTIGGGRLDFNTVLQEARDSGVPNEMVPLCEDNGDYYCVVPRGEVIYWSHNGTTDEKWPNVAAWISEVWIGGN